MKNWHPLVICESVTNEMQLVSLLMLRNSSQWHHTFQLTEIIIAQKELPHNLPPFLYSWLHQCNLKVKEVKE
jgi:hypothetical protein